MLEEDLNDLGENFEDNFEDLDDEDDPEDLGQGGDEKEDSAPLESEDESF